MTLFAMERKLTAFDSNKLSQEVMENNIQVLEEINKSQLYDGKMRDGNHLHPTYFEDPFFKSPAQAIAYSNWKDRITPNSERPSGVPNLIINGFYYNSRKVSVQGNKIVYDTSAGFAKDFTVKYGEGINGLGGKYRAEFLKDYVGPEFRQKVTSFIGLKFK